MAARVLDGAAVANAIRAEVAPGVAAFTARAGRPPGLGIVLVGDDPASDIYVRNKLKSGAEAGLRLQAVGVTGAIAVAEKSDSGTSCALLVGGTAALTTTAHDSDNGPAPLSYEWSANGALLKTKGPNLTFACSSPGDVVVQVVLSDGDTNPGCADHLSVNLRCDLP